MGIDVAGVEAEAQYFLNTAPAGPGLPVMTRALIRFALSASATALAVEALDELAAQALKSGADEELLIEVLMLASAVGVHALHEGVLALNRIAAVRPGEPASSNLLRVRSERSNYWRRLDMELPGFLAGLARRSPWAYEAFMSFVGAPAREGRLERLPRELIWASLDAAPTHRYVPGLRLHLANALKLGASRAQLEEALLLAANAPGHTGVPRHRLPT
jgi:alkylhydroperoxidase/carboxymuconolactone decarboxylase family protein YurZ